MGPEAEHHKRPHQVLRHQLYPGSIFFIAIYYYKVLRTQEIKLKLNYYKVLRTQEIKLKLKRLKFI
jgi:hypothetical protein